MTGTCQYCGKAIRMNRAGIWGARARTDPHPWYCDDNPDERAARHAPRLAEGGLVEPEPS